MHRIRIIGLASILALLSTGILSAQEPENAEIIPISARMETSATPGDGATAPVIWLHPDDLAQSVIIATDENAGILVYDLNGEQLQFVEDGNIKNADLRYNFPLGDRRVTLVAAGVEDEPAVLFYTLDPNTRTLEKLTDFDTNIAVNGVCMYHSARTGTYYVFATGTDGAVEQYALTAPDGELTLELARSFNVGSETDSCVADDEIGAFYISEEEVALWRYGAEPENGTSRRIVDHVNSWVGGSISEQVEGLTLLYGADRTGYLIAANEKATVFWCTNAPAKTS